MSDLISIVTDSLAVPTNTRNASAPSTKISKRFGRSPPQSIASVSHSSTFSKSFPFSKTSKNRQKTLASPSAVTSILNGMYAHSINQSPGEMSPPDPGPSKTPFIYRKVERPSTATSAESSGPSSTAENAIAILRARTLSDNSGLLGITEHSLQSIAGLQVEAPEQPTASTSSLELEPISSGRLVGRGGIGSRPRKATATKILIIPTLQSLDATLTADSPHIALRPSGRGGLASRPKQLAPPSPPKLPLAEQPGPLHLVSPTKPTPAFVRPGGRGGMGAHANADTPPLTLKDILSRKKPKFGKKSKARARNVTTLKHPISSHLANEITNASTETLSTLHFAGESASPPPSFFHEPRQSIESAGADAISLTPPSSATASTFDGSLSPETEEDDLDINIYLEDATNLSPEDRQQRSISKLTRTFGDNPYDEGSGALTPTVVPAHSGSLSKILIDGDTSTKKDKSTKKFRRASISVSSIFGRPTRIQSSDDLDSQSTIDTISDDLHRLGLDDDDMSESWGEVEIRRMSMCGAPESPILFSLPSPLPLPETETKRKSTLSTVYSVDSDQSISVPSTLSRSQSYSRSSGLQNTRINHNHSVSTSVTEYAFSEDTSAASSVNWLFPPSSDDHDFKLLVTSNKYPEERLPWTGEWNTDINDVIRALRELR